jgi:uncharacterized RDD family membrane protein YckC
VDVSRQVGWRPGAYAGFWQRVGGYLIDVLLFAAVLLILGLLLLVIVGGGAEGRTAQTWVNWLGIVAFFAYDTVLTHRYGATLGKRVAGIEVRRPDGTLPSYGVCVGRYFARILSGVVLFIGFLWPVFDPKRQTWHDKIVDTFVIRRADIVRTAEDGPPPAAARAGQASGAMSHEPDQPADGDQRPSSVGAGGALRAGGAEPARQDFSAGDRADGAGAQPGPAAGEGGVQPTPSNEPSSETGSGTQTPSQGPGQGPGGSLPAEAWRPAQEDERASGQAGGGGPVGATMETARWGAAPRQEPRGEDPPEQGADTAESHPSTMSAHGEPDAVEPAGMEPAGMEPAGGEPDRVASSDAPPEPGAVEPDRLASSDAPGFGARGSERADLGAGTAAAQPTAPRSERADPNLVAIDRASLSPDSAGWLRQVAEQVDPRLDRVAPDWRSSPQADAARACAFGILLGHLARVHRHMALDLGKVAEVHPSFSTLLAGSRLSTLEQIAAEPGRATAWLGPLIDVEDRERISRLLA